MGSHRSLPLRLPGFVALALCAISLSACNVQSASDDLGTLPAQPKAMVADDFDGDGTTDVLVGYSAGDYAGVTHATQDGYGFWSRADLGTFVFGSELLATTDLSGDGAPDVIAAQKGLDRFNVLANSGDGTFTNTTKILSPTSPPGSVRVTAMTSATAASGTRLVSVAYETDDPDAFVKPRSVVTYRASGGSLTNANTFQWFDTVPGDARVLKLHDMDGDAKLDLLVGTAAGTVQIYRGSGSDGSFATTPTTLSAAGHAVPVTALTAGDAATIPAAPVAWSVDGRADVLATFADGSEVFGWRGGESMAFGGAQAMGVINGGSRRFFELAVSPDGSGGWGGLATGQASAFAQTSGGYGFANIDHGGPVAQCEVSTGALFPNDAVGFPFAGAIACAAPGSPRLSVVIPGRARMTVPQSLALGNVRARHEGPVTTATLSQTDYSTDGGVGSGGVAIQQVRIEGPDAGDFELVRGETGPCYLPHQPEEEPCQPQVRFKPATPGPKHAELVVESSAYRAPGTPPHSIPLSGTGTGAVTSAPATLALGDVAYGSSASAPVVVHNSGNEALTISSLMLENAGSGWSVDPGTCASAVQPGANCVAHVTYAPTATGSATGLLRVLDNGVGAAQVVSLSARGIGSGVTAAPVAFGPVAVGASGSATAEVVNSGEVALQISSVAVAGPDTPRVTVEGSDCVGAAVAPGGSCDVDLSFAPGARGALDATLRVTSNAPSSPNVVALSGQGLQGIAQAPAELALGTVTVGFFAEQQVTVSNTGDAPLALGALAVEGPVELTNDDCSSATLAVGGDCTATVRFTPTAAGPLDARLKVPNDGVGGERAIDLTGLALAADEEPGPDEPGSGEPKPELPGSGPEAPGPDDGGGPGPDRRDAERPVAPRAALALSVPERAMVRRGGTLRLRVRLRGTGSGAVPRTKLRLSLPAGLSWRPPRGSARKPPRPTRSKPPGPPRSQPPRPTRTVVVEVGRLAPGVARTVTLTLNARPRARRGPVRLTVRAAGAGGATATATTTVRIG
jgi:hypothetical protein